MTNYLPQLKSPGIFPVPDHQRGVEKCGETRSLARMDPVTPTTIPAPSPPRGIELQLPHHPPDPPSVKSSPPVWGSSPQIPPSTMDKVRINPTKEGTSNTVSQPRRFVPPPDDRLPHPPPQSPAHNQSSKRYIQLLPSRACPHPPA